MRLGKISVIVDATTRVFVDAHLCKVIVANYILQVFQNHGCRRTGDIAHAAGAKSVRLESPYVDETVRRPKWMLAGILDLN